MIIGFGKQLTKSLSQITGTVLSVFIFCQYSANAQTAPYVNGQWKSLGSLTTAIKPINANLCNARVVLRSSDDFYGTILTRIAATRIRNHTLPTGFTAAPTQSLQFDLTFDDLPFLSIAGLIDGATYNKISKLYLSEHGIAPTSLFISIQLTSSGTPVAHLNYPNRASVNEGSSVPLLKTSTVRLESSCFLAN